MAEGYDEYAEDDEDQDEFTGEDGVLTKFWDLHGKTCRLTVPGCRKLSFFNFAKDKLLDYRNAEGI